MIYLGLLATNPAFQGKGYGSAMVQQVNSIVCLVASVHYAPKLESVLESNLLHNRRIVKIVQCGSYPAISQTQHSITRMGSLVSVMPS